MGGPFMSALCFLTPTSYLLSYRLLKPTPPSSFIMAVCESNKSSFQWWWKNQIQVLFGEFVTHVWFGTCLSVFCSSYCTNNLETLFCWRQYFLIFNHEWKKYYESNLTIFCHWCYGKCSMYLLIVYSFVSKLMHTNNPFNFLLFSIYKLLFL